MSKIIGYTAGVFDMFHIGHLNILQKAKMQCDFLIVAVSIDKLVMQVKKKHPIIPYESRAAIVSAIKYVDAVVPQENMNKMLAWEKYHFHKMFVGSDWKNSPAWLHWEKEFAPLGVEIVYFPHTDGISSTLLAEIIKKDPLS